MQGFSFVQPLTMPAKNKYGEIVVPKIATRIIAESFVHCIVGMSEWKITSFQGTCTTNGKQCNKQNKR